MQTSVLYSAGAVELDVQNGVAIPANTGSILSAGSDGTNARYISVNSSGQQVVTGPGTAGAAAAGVITIQGIASMTPVQVSQATAGNLNATVVGSGNFNVIGTGTAGAAAAGVVTVQGIAGGTNIPVSISGTPAVTITSGTTVVTQPTAANLNATVVGSGNFTVVQATAASLNATVTGTVAATQSGTWTGRVTDGTNTATVKAASTAAVVGDSALVVAISPNNTIPVSIGSAVTVAQATAASLNATVIGTGTAGSTYTTGVFTIQGTATGTPIPITGTISATNPSVGTTGSTTPTSGTLVAGTNGSNLTAITATTAGTSVSTGVLTIQGNASGVPVPITGTISATNPSVGTNAAAIPTSSTLIGGSDGANIRPILSTTAGNIIPAPAADISGTGSLGSLNANILIATNGLTTVCAGITGSWSGTITFQFTVDGSNWVNDVVSNAATNALSTTTTVNGTFIFAVGGYKQYRIVMTAYTSGSATVAYDGGVGQNVSMTTALITDGTNGNVAVKPASTAAVATDPALVVAISPNNPLTISTANTVATGTLGSLNASVTLAMAGLNAAGFQLATGTLIGTIIAQCSIDNGVTWNTTSIDQATNGQKTASIVFASANTATAGHIVGIGGTTHVRVTVSLYTSGTANITITGSMMSDPTLISTGPAGTPNPPTTMFIGGTDGSNIRNLLTDTSGRQVVVGGAANAAAVAGNPVLISGWNATNAYTLLTDTSGRLNMVGAASAGSAVVGNPVLMGGSDGSNARTISTNSSGQVVVVGAGTASAASGGLITTQGPVATGTAIGSAGFPILMAGSDGANLRSLSTNTSGQLVVFGSGTAGTNYTTGVVTVQGSSTGTAIPISGAVSITGTVTVTESSIGSTGSAVPSFANMIGGTDGSNLRALSTTSTGALNVTSANITATGALGSLNAAVSLAMAGAYYAGFQLAAGTLIGTIIAQCSIDGGVTWNTTSIDLATTGQKVSSVVFASSNTATAAHIVGLGGTTHVRVTVSAYTSGTANITITGSMMDDPTLVSTGPNGTAVPPTSFSIAGSDGTLLRNLLTDTTGRALVYSSDNTVTGTLASTTQTTAVPCAGAQSVSFQLSSSLVGTLVPLISFDGGTSYITGPGFYDPIKQAFLGQSLVINPAALQELTLIIPAGTSHARVNCSAFTSGSSTYFLRATTANTQPSFQTILDGGKATYSASVANIATVSGATDVFTIFGSASKTVRVLFVEIYGTAATAVAVPVSLIRRSATNTAGTSASVTAALHDTLLNPAATATVLSYTANPTGLGAAAGTVKNIKLYFPTTANSPSGIQYLFGGAQFPGGQGIVLRGTTQGLCVNFNSTAITTASVSMSFMFTEE